MTDESRRVPIKVRVVDKRKTNPQLEVESEAGTDEETASAPLRQTVFKPPLRETASSSEEDESRFVDAGVDASADEAPSSAGEDPESVSDEGSASSSAPTVGGKDDGADYLDDLRRLQAEFDNFRKRTFRERQQLEARGKTRLVEHLLPVLDNFERAIAHGEGGAGVELVFKELKSALEGEGLAEIPAEGVPFDPQVHEAVESVEDTEVVEPTVTQVYRRGYTFGGEVVRPAMVVVARPAEIAAQDDDTADVAEGGG
ncbi:MAG TPA: nucleotide exchange factor GrpE [Actinomycetota bacterium]|jgi:molecular chaperone GrpE